MIGQLCAVLEPTGPTLSFGCRALDSAQTPYLPYATLKCEAFGFTCLDLSPLPLLSIVQSISELIDDPSKSSQEKSSYLVDKVLEQQ